MPDAKIIPIGPNLPERVAEMPSNLSFPDWLRALAKAVDDGKFPNLERALCAGYDFTGHVQYDVSRQLRKDQVVAVLEMTKLTVAMR